MTAGPRDPFAGLVERGPEPILRRPPRPTAPPPPPRRPATAPAAAGPTLTASERARARAATGLGLKALIALELLAGAKGLGDIGRGTRKADGTVTVHHALARTLAAAGYVTLRHDVKLVRLAPAGRQLVAVRRGKVRPVARWSAAIVDLDGPLDRWALEVARALLAGDPAPAWPGRWRATGRDRVATIRRLLGLEELEPAPDAPDA